jgi:hypothetical protein
MMDFKEVPVIGNWPVGGSGVHQLGWPVLVEIVYQGTGIGRGKNIAFDDAVVEEAVEDIGNDEAGFAHPGNCGQLLVGVQFPEEI